MAWHLFRLGRWSFLHRKLVAGIWVLLLVLGGVGAATLAGATDDQFQLPGIESTEAFDLINSRTPGASADGATARVVFQAPAGEKLGTAATKKAVASALATAKTADVRSIANPFTAGTVAQNGTVGYATISYAKTAVELSTKDLDALDDAKTAAIKAGLKVAIGGDAITPAPAPPIAELIGVVVALVVLLITFGSLIAAGMPLLTALLGVGLGVTGITTLTGFVSLSSVTPALGTMLGLAVGVDYALFIMSRYRHEVREGAPLDEAAGRAVGTAGSAVIFAGLTVIIALVGLSVTGIGFLTQMGLGGAATVAIAVLIALTLLPAILGFAGHRVVKAKIPFLRDRDGEGFDDVRTNGLRWVELISRFRVPALIAGVLAAVVISIPVASMQLALPDDATKPAGSDSRVAYDLIAANFGAGANGPLVVVIDTAKTRDTTAAHQAVDAAVADLTSIKTDIAAVVPPLTSTTPAARAAFDRQLAGARFATITVVPRSGPSDARTKDLVDTIRGRLAGLSSAAPGARALVTGQTAVGVDISQKLTWPDPDS